MLSTLGVKVRVNEESRNKEYSGVSYDASTVVLTIEGLENVLDCLLPLLLSLKDHWYWKEDQLNVFSIVEEYYAVKAHQLIAGLTNLPLASRAFSSNHPTLRQKGLVIKEKVVNFLLEINYGS
jgi:hypothetical protein